MARSLLTGSASTHPRGEGAADGEAALSVSGIEKSYGAVQALRGVDLDVYPGEVIGLVGPNGAGKTSLLSIIAGLRRPDRGRVVVDGVDVVRHPERIGARLGLAPQELGVYPSQTVNNNLKLFAQLAGLRGTQRKDRIEETAVALGLEDLMRRKAKSLSGGQKRRLHTAIALIHHPPVLLLDEPTTGADVESRNALLTMVDRLAAEGAAICYSTHYLPEMEALGASIVIIDQGVVIARGGLAELTAAHARPAVELRFDGQAPSLPGATAVDESGSLIRIEASNPAAAAAEALGLLDSHASRLRSVEFSEPSLESVYLAITGRRYRGDESERTGAIEEDTDVATP